MNILVEMLKMQIFGMDEKNALTDRADEEMDADTAATQVMMCLLKQTSGFQLYWNNIVIYFIITWKNSSGGAALTFCLCSGEGCNQRQCVVRVSEHINSRMTQIELVKLPFDIKKHVFAHLIQLFKSTR